MEPELIYEIVPGDNQYQQGIVPAYDAMVNQDLFTSEPTPDYRNIAGTVARNVVTNAAIKKLGIEGLKGNLLKGVVSGNALVNPLSLSNPFTAAFTIGSMLPDSVKGIAGLLRGKRAEKAIARNIISDNQGNINTIDPNAVNRRTQIMNMPATLQEQYRGGRDDYGASKAAEAATQKAADRAAGTRSARGADFGSRFHG